MDLFFEALRAGLKGERLKADGRQFPAGELRRTLALSDEQAVTGLVFGGLEGLPLTEYGLEKRDVLQQIGRVQTIRTRNRVMDAAVARLSCELKERGVRFLVFKGQTLAALYPSPDLRQSGDIDFYVHPDDLPRALAWVDGLVESGAARDYVDNTTEKHVSFGLGDVTYELHRSLTAFAAPRHQRYWDEVVMPFVWQTAATVRLGGVDVPTLGGTANALYVFVHLFYHLFDGGVGLRQFCDWLMVVRHLDWPGSDRALLERHLRGVGLWNAYRGLGAVLTDYLGLEASQFPFAIPPRAHRQAPALVENILMMGNFGHNRTFAHASGVRHGLSHLRRIFSQSWRFGHYAPSESWGRIPYLFRWWWKKVGRRIKN